MLPHTKETIMSKYIPTEILLILLAFSLQPAFAASQYVPFVENFENGATVFTVQDELSISNGIVYPCPGRTGACQFFDNTQPQNEANAWKLQLHKVGLNLNIGKRYKFSAYVRAENATLIGFALHIRSSRTYWDTIGGLNHWCDVGTEWKLCHFSFDSGIKVRLDEPEPGKFVESTLPLEAADLANAQLFLSFGRVNGKVWADDIMLYEEEQHAAIITPADMVVAPPHHTSKFSPGSSTLEVPHLYVTTPRTSNGDGPVSAYNNIKLFLNFTHSTFRLLDAQPITYSVPSAAVTKTEIINAPIIPADFPLVAGWAQAATMSPNQTGSPARVIVDYLQLVEEHPDSGVRVVAEKHYDVGEHAYRSVPGFSMADLSCTGCEGGSYEWWFPLSVKAFPLENGKVKGGLFDINLAARPDRIAHWGTKQVSGKTGSRYFVLMRVKIEGNVGVQIGLDYVKRTNTPNTVTAGWCSSNANGPRVDLDGDGDYDNDNRTTIDEDGDGILESDHCEAWASDWYGDTQGKFIVIKAPNY
jgi:hypothetical protein